MSDPDSEDVAKMLDDIAKRLRGESPSFRHEASGLFFPTPDLDEQEASFDVVDIFTDERHVTVTMETRNVDPAAVQVSLLHGKLLVALGDLQKDVLLPAAVQEDAALATFRNGVLDVVLPLRRG